MDAASGSIRSTYAVAIAFVRGRTAVLRHTGFRRLLAGRAASVLGDGLFLLAAIWLGVPSLRRFGPPTAVPLGHFV